jgi:putative alpha-1,2-mannosidase
MPGNDDLGAMSSWWVMSALGLYPAVPGTDLLAVGSTLFRSTTLRLPGGVVRIRASRAGHSRPYVRRLLVDGHRRGRAWLHFRSLRRGARLRFDLSNRPDRRFGARPADAPPSFGPAAAAPRCAR